MDKLVDENNSLRSKDGFNNRERDKLNIEVESLSNELNILRARLVGDSIGASNFDLELQKNKAEIMTTKYKSEVENMRKEIEKIDTENQTLYNDYRLCKEALLRCSRENEEMLLSRNSNEDTIKSLSRKIDELQKENGALNDRMLLVEQIRSATYSDKFPNRGNNDPQSLFTFNDIHNSIPISSPVIRPGLHNTNKFSLQ